MKESFTGLVCVALGAYLGSAIYCKRFTTFIGDRDFASLSGYLQDVVSVLGKTSQLVSGFANKRGMGNLLIITL